MLKMSKFKSVFQKTQNYFIDISLTKFIIYTILFAWSFTTIIPFLWVINNSFRDSFDIMNDPFIIADSFNLQNYINAVDRINVIRSYMNSIIMSGSTVILVLLFGGMASYVLARFNFRFKTSIKNILAIGLLIPAFVTVIPVYELLIEWDLVNTYLALILPHTAGNLIFAILILTTYMASLSREVEEAAILDGASRWQIFIRIFVPMSRPAFATVGIFTFLWSFNDLFLALVYVNQKSVRPIVALLNAVTSQYGTDYGLHATAVVVTVIPVLIVYLILQENIVKGLTAGAYR